MNYVPTIGLEIHAELKTNTKMFCNSKNDPDETRPNVNICPICMAHPGTLPVINKEAVKHVLMVGCALGSKLADYTEFDRKNYFYPDLPKGYQLSQYEYPLVSGGYLNGIAIRRVHLEEDTASSLHDEETGFTTIDYNRAGVPLMELVTEPVIKSAKEAGDFGRELQLLLRYLGVSDANMEKGEMRVEANVSVAPEGSRAESYVEIKNLNSFRAMERAVEFEIKRQSEVLAKGGVIKKETLGWDEKKQATFSQRTKEGSADYRYFPDPDLPSLRLSELPEFSSKALQEGMPELPSGRRNRYVQIGAKAEDAEKYVTDQAVGRFFEEVVVHLKGKDKSIAIASNYIANDVLSLIRDTDARDTENKDEIPIKSEHFAHLADMLVEGSISSRAGKEILKEMMTSQKSPSDIAEERGLLQKSNRDELQPLIEGLLKDQASVVEDYKKGKEAALKYLVGQGMRITKGAGNPQVIEEIIRGVIG